MNGAHTQNSAKARKSSSRAASPGFLQSRSESLQPLGAGPRLLRLVGRAARAGLHPAPRAAPRPRRGCICPADNPSPRRPAQHPLPGVAAQEDAARPRSLPGAARPSRSTRLSRKEGEGARGERKESVPGSERMSSRSGDAGGRVGRGGAGWGEAREQEGLCVCLCVYPRAAGPVIADVGPGCGPIGDLGDCSSPRARAAAPKLYSLPHASRCYLTSARGFK